MVCEHGKWSAYKVIPFHILDVFDSTAFSNFWCQLVKHELEPGLIFGIGFETGIGSSTCSKNQNQTRTQILVFPELETELRSWFKKNWNQNHIWDLIPT